MTKTTFQELLNKYELEYPLAMNVVFAQFAKEHGILLNMATDDYKELQAIEVTSELEQVLTLLGVKMSPTVSELEALMRNRTNPNEIIETSVLFSGNEEQYVGIIFEDILVKTLLLWIDINKLKKTKETQDKIEY